MSLAYDAAEKELTEAATTIERLTCEREQLAAQQQRLMDMIGAQTTETMRALVRASGWRAAAMDNLAAYIEALDLAAEAMREGLAACERLRAHRDALEGQCRQLHQAIATRNASIARQRADAERFRVERNEGRAEVERLNEELSLVRETARRAVAVVVPRFKVFGSITSSKRRGSVELPGGKVEPGERDWDAAKREAEEELGVAVTVHPLPLGEFLHVDQSGRAWLCTAYVGDIHGAHLGSSDEGTSGWATREELFAGALGPVARRILAAYDARVKGGA